MVTYTGQIYQSDVDKLRQRGYSEYIGRLTNDWSEISWNPGWQTPYYYKVIPGTRPTAIAPPSQIWQYIGYVAPTPVPVSTPTPTPIPSVTPTPVIQTPTTTPAQTPVTPTPPPAPSPTPVQQTDYSKIFGTTDYKVSGSYVMIGGAPTSPGWAVYTKDTKYPSGYRMLEGGSSTAQIPAQWLSLFGVQQRQSGGGSLAADLKYGKDQWQVLDEVNAANKLIDTYNKSITPTPIVETPISKRDADIARLSVFTQLTGEKPADVSKTGTPTYFNVKTEKTSTGTQATTTYTKPVDVSKIDLSKATGPDLGVPVLVNAESFSSIQEKRNPAEKAGMNIQGLAEVGYTPAPALIPGSTAWLGYTPREIQQWGTDINKKYSDVVDKQVAKIKNPIIRSIAGGITDLPTMAVDTIHSIPLVTEVTRQKIVSDPLGFPKFAGSAVLAGGIMTVESAKKDPVRFASSAIGMAVLTGVATKTIAPKVESMLPVEKPGTVSYYAGLALKQKQKTPVTMEAAALELESMKTNMAKSVVSMNKAKLAQIGRTPGTSLKTEYNLKNLGDYFKMETKLVEQYSPAKIVEPAFTKYQAIQKPKSLSVSGVLEYQEFKMPTRTIGKVTPVVSASTPSMSSSMSVMLGVKVAPEKKLILLEDSLRFQKPGTMQYKQTQMEIKNIQMFTGVKSPQQKLSQMVPGTQAYKMQLFDIQAVRQEFAYSVKKEFISSLKEDSGLKQDTVQKQVILQKIPTVEKLNVMMGVAVGTKQQTQLDTSTHISQKVDQRLAQALGQRTTTIQRTPIRAKTDIRLTTGFKTTLRNDFGKPPSPIFTPFIPKPPTQKFTFAFGGDKDIFKVGKMKKWGDFAFREKAHVVSIGKAMGSTVKKTRRRKK